VSVRTTRGHPFPGRSEPEWRGRKLRLGQCSLSYRLTLTLVLRLAVGLSPPALQLRSVARQSATLNIKGATRCKPSGRGHRASRILFISGQIGAEPDGTTPSSTAAQARLAWRNLAAQLAAAGMGFDNLVKVTTIIPDATDIPASRAARAEALGDRRPASTLIVGGLANPAWRIEIEAIACA
jgi:2-iminobutanoate/2-iminopropanoate deaminase